jgi:hypothetical protein
MEWERDKKWSADLFPLQMTVSLTVTAFQTAVALAEFEAVKDQEGKIVLTDKHLRAVVEMSRDFKEYLHDLHKGDEEKRAERRHERLDKSVMI